MDRNKLQGVTTSRERENGVILPKSGQGGRSRRPTVRHRGTAAEDFYSEVLRLVQESEIQFLVGGTYAVNAYLEMERPTKDLDLFCRAGDYLKVMERAAGAGIQTTVEDERWLAKLKKGRLFVDIIFGSANAVAPVTDQWFEQARPGRILQMDVRLIPPTELIWSKAFIQDRYRNDTSDLIHVMLVQHQQIDWKRLMSYFEQYWEVLLVHVLNFRFIYPSERDRVPRWLLEELLNRARRQMGMPPPERKVCRGRLYSRGEYEIDLVEWGFSDLIG